MVLLRRFKILLGRWISGTSFGIRIAGEVENIAWSSVQIQCLCQTAATSPDQQPQTSLRQSEAGSRELASTQPKILFCDLTLSPAEVRTFDFEDLVPLGCPSTYHGRHFRYSYRVVVSSQRIHRWKKNSHRMDPNSTGMQVGRHIVQIKRLGYEKNYRRNPRLLWGRPCKELQKSFLGKKNWVFFGKTLHFLKKGMS